MNKDSAFFCLKRVAYAIAGKLEFRHVSGRRVKHSQQVGGRWRSLLLFARRLLQLSLDRRLVHRYGRPEQRFLLVVLLLLQQLLLIQIIILLLLLLLLLRLIVGCRWLLLRLIVGRWQLLLLLL